jgi:hypothetical protein
LAETKTIAQTANVVADDLLRQLSVFHKTNPPNSEGGIAGIFEIQW